MGMIMMPEALKKANLEARMLLQVHDELIFEVPEKDLKEAKNIITETMESAAELSVPLVCDTGYGSNWDEAH